VPVLAELQLSLCTCKYHEKNEHQEFLDPEDKAFYPTKQLGNHEEISSPTLCAILA